MEQTVVFEQKVFLTPKDMNRMGEKNLDEILLEHLRDSLENKCSQHGFVIPSSLELVSRSMGHLDNGRFTGNVLFHAQVRGLVYNPVNGTRLTGTILKKNKMGLYVIYKDAIRVLVARDLHRDNEEFEALQVGDGIKIEIRKSRFQIRDPFILSIGVFLEKSNDIGVVEVPAVESGDSSTSMSSLSTVSNVNEKKTAEQMKPGVAEPAQQMVTPDELDDDMFEDGDEGPD